MENKNVRALVKENRNYISVNISTGAAVRRMSNGISRFYCRYITLNIHKTCANLH